MQAIWIDTGPLLELTIHELGTHSVRAFKRLERRLICFPSRTLAARFSDRMRDFGAVRFSSGSVVELYQLVRGDLKDRRGDTALMQDFWRAFNTVMRKENACCVPMAFEHLDSATLPRFGPVDAHLLAEIGRDQEAWLATGDTALSGVGSVRSRDRVLHLPS